MFKLVGFTSGVALYSYVGNAGARAVRPAGERRQRKALRPSSAAARCSQACLSCPKREVCPNARAPKAEWSLESV